MLLLTENTILIGVISNQAMIVKCEATSYSKLTLRDRSACRSCFCQRRCKCGSLLEAKQVVVNGILQCFGGVMKWELHIKLAKCKLFARV